jgi:HEAT repeats
MIARGLPITAARIPSWAVVALCAMARTAHAAPLATLLEDVDGDGAPDAIELGGDGVVHIAGTPRGEVKLAAAITRGQLAVAHYRGKPYVIAQIVPALGVPGAAVDAGPATAGEAVVLRADGGSWHEVVRFALGGVGLDHDYGVAIDATADGIYRYQTRSDIRRCDGKPAYLFAEKFDGTRFRRSSALPSNVADGVPTLAARLDAARAQPPLLYQAHAASLEIGAGDAGGLAIPRELDDGRLDTLWREELAASTGEGQFFTFEPRAADVRARQIRIVPGNPTSSATWHSFNRPHKLAVVAASGAWRIELPDAASEPPGAAYVIDLPAPVAGCVTVILESTYGAPQGTTAIAELEVFAEGERSGGGEALLAQVVAEGAAGAKTAASALGKRGAAGAAAIDGALAATTDQAARRRLIGALVAIHDPSAVPALVHAATAGWVRDQDLVEVIGALGGLGEREALRALAANRALPTAARAAAIARLPATGAGLAMLIELDAGLGVRELRRAVIDQISGAPVEALIAAAAAQPSAPVAGDLWRAMTRSVRAAPANRAPVLAAMRAALPAASDYERRYRLLDGIATLGDAAALRALAAVLRGLPDTAESAALRQVAVRAVAGAPRPEAIDFAIAAARDRDPGVRLAALGALGGEPDARNAPAAEVDHAIDEVLGDVLDGDAWPEVRRRAATTLGGRCQRPGPARVLVDAIDHDHELGVRGNAMSALVQCHAAGVAAVLARVWDDARAPLELRSRAVLEAAALGDPALAARLVGKLAQWRGEVMTSTPALTLAQSAAATLGRLNPPGAAQALSEALDDASFPEIVQAAAFGLGALGPACPATAKAKLAALAHSDDTSAIAARRAAAQCGR